MPQAVPTPDQKRYTVAEYFEMEQAATERHMYLDGQIIAMAGGTGEHAIIMSNVAAACSVALAGKSCRHVDSNLAVRYGRRSNYGYTDGLIVCRPLRYDSTYGDHLILLNPTLVFEILSPTTEKFDRGEKFSYYREIESFREYVLVAQDRPRIETFYRQDDGAWRIATFDGLDARVPLASVGVELSAREVYADVTFASEPAMPPELVPPKA